MTGKNTFINLELELFNDRVYFVVTTKIVVKSSSTPYGNVCMYLFIYSFIIVSLSILAFLGY